MIEIRVVSRTYRTSRRSPFMVSDRTVGRSKHGRAQPKIMLLLFGSPPIQELYKFQNVRKMELQYYFETRSKKTTKGWVNLKINILLTPFMLFGSHTFQLGVFPICVNIM